MEHPPNPYPSQQHNPAPACLQCLHPGPLTEQGSSERRGRGLPTPRPAPEGPRPGAITGRPLTSCLQAIRCSNTTGPKTFPPGPQGEHQSSAANPYPPRQHYQVPPYPHPEPPDPPPLRLPLPAPLGPLHLAVCVLLQPDAGSPQALPRPARRPPVQPVPIPSLARCWAKYPNPPPRRDVVHEPVLRPQGLRNREGWLARQGSLPGPSPNWTIHTEEDRGLLGVVYDSVAFPQHNRTGGPTTRLTVMMGGAWFQEVFGNPEEVTEQLLLERATQAVTSHLGVTTPPIWSVVALLKNCIPQYYLGHWKRLENMRQYIKDHNLTLSLAGSSYDGVSVNDVIFSGRTAAEGLVGKV
ncbi:hypothetical protein J4Q44_G00021880 [Coregonus suidteri]|uniref:Amine oxidase domain-containing protein n=1 Tax=Coregonus suidteri TaxID=861788 RepID=A0AAN8MGY8_9TELE